MRSRYGTYYSDYYNKPSCVYRLFDDEGTLLYVGMALRPDNRIVRHRRKPWGHLIARTEVEWLDNREQAKDSERWAIHHEKPLYNLVRPNLECC